jgi:putative transposase
MPRSSRLIDDGQPTVYHVMSRTALDGFPFDDIAKDELLESIKGFSQLYFAEILGFCLMGNHFHLLVRMQTANEYTDEQIEQRYSEYHGPDSVFPSGKLDYFRRKWSSLSEFVKDIKQTFSRAYNKRHGRRGTLWGERFKSVIVEKGETLINCLAYIDLNPIRAGIVKRPEDYRWSSLGYHVQTGNKDNFLSMDFGLKEFGMLSPSKRLQRYRQYVYEAGAIHPSGKKASKRIDKQVINKESRKDFELDRIDRFRYRTRYFTDSGIIGTKAFVSKKYKLFKHLFQSKHEKIPKPVKGINGLYSLKRLSKAI